MTSGAKLLDCVAMLRDFPEHGVSRGDVGTVVEVFGDDAYEVEFVGEDGATSAMFAVPQKDCLPVHLGAAERPVTGVVGSLWYWYDPNDDVLDVRLVSKRDAAGVTEPTPDGMMVVREAAGRGAIGLIVRGFWQRFGAGARDREGLERRVGALGVRLAA